jgi:putative tributyrin esterase
MKKLMIVIAFSILTTFCWGQARSFVDSVFSNSLDRIIPISVIVPSSYDFEQPTPILYLLHGHSIHHDYFLNYTRIEQYVEESSMLCIMPEVGNSWYINSITEPNDRFEDYMMIDLPEFIEEKYNVDTDRQSIAGFSMGGYGAIVLALRNPDKYVFAASIAGAIMIPRDIESIENSPLYEFAIPSMDKAFGEKPNKYRVEHDPFQIYKHHSPQDLPYIFIFSGLQDYFPEIVSAQRELADSLNAYGALYEYHEMQGGHSSKTADASVRMMLQRIKYLNNYGFRSLAGFLSEQGSEGITDQILMKVKSLNENFKDIYYLDMFEMNKLGYNLMVDDRLDDAIKVFKLNIEFFPKSAWCYDSMSDAYIKANDMDLALKCVKKAVELLPLDTTLNESHKNQLNDILPKKLKELK